MKYKKLLLILMTAILMLGTIAGCGEPSKLPASSNQNDASDQSAVSERDDVSGGDAASDSDSVSASETISKKPTASQSKKVDINEKRDLENRTIVFLANWTEPVKGSSDWDNKYWAKKTSVEKTYNCKFEHKYMSSGDVYKVFLTSIMSGKPSADIVCSKNNPYAAIREGLFYDLSKLDEFDFSKGNWFSAVADMGKVGNKQYLMLSTRFQPLNLIFYNKNTFKQYQQQDLYTLQKQGKLTLDKLVEIATEISKKTNAVSMRSDTNPWRTHILFSYAYSGKFVTRDPGTLNFTATLNSTAVITGFKRAQDLIAAKVLSNGLDSTSWTYGRETFNKGTLPILMAAQNIESAFRNAKFDVGVCVMPDTKGGMISTAYEMPWCAIPYNAKDPGDVAFIWNHMTDAVLNVNYKERYQDVVSDECMDIINTLSAMQLGKGMDVDYSFAATDVGSSSQSTFNQMLAGTITPAQAIQKMEPLYKASLKSYLN